jgi:Fic family protein
MNSLDFGDHAQGELVRIPGGLAFIPNELPPQLPPSWGLTRAAEEARAAIAALSARIEQMSEPENLLHLLRRREAVLSNRIEGTITHVRDVLLAEAAPPPPTRENQEVREVINYSTALETGRRLLKEGHPLRLSIIRGLHEQLMQSVRGQNRHPGELRTTYVQIGGVANEYESAHFVPPPPEQVPPLMDNLVAFIAEPSQYGPLIDSAIIHYQFETIHPFEDGNGRLGRLLIPLYLENRQALGSPTLYLSGYLNQHRDEYIDRLYSVSSKGEWVQWISFFLTAVKEQSIDTDRRVRRIIHLQNSYREQTRALKSGAHQAVDLIIRDIVVSASEVANFTGTSNPTARTALQRLADMGIVRSAGRVQGKELWIAEQLVRELEATP